jgi:hypothetical protein
MKSFKIVKANYSKSGNAYFVDKARNSFFVSKSLLESKNIKSATDLKFPLYVNVSTFTYNNMEVLPTNADGTPNTELVQTVVLNADGTPSTFTRTDVIDIFSSAQELADDFADDHKLELLKTQAVINLGTSAGLTTEQVNRLATQSV